MNRYPLQWLVTRVMSYGKIGLLFCFDIVLAKEAYK